MKKKRKRDPVAELETRQTYKHYFERLFEAIWFVGKVIVAAVLSLATAFIFVFEWLPLSFEILKRPGMPAVALAILVFVFILILYLANEIRIEELEDIVESEDD